MSCVTNCYAPVVLRDYLYTSSWELLHRRSYSGFHGVHTLHASNQFEAFNIDFHSRLGSAMQTINLYAAYQGHGTIQWIGDIGVTNCKAGCHSTGNAFDLTALELYNSNFDMNASWRSGQSLAQRRGYLAIWTGLRIYCKTVLTNTYDVHHRNHIHVDNDGNHFAPPPIRTTVRTDITFIQTSCNLLNNTNLSVDGIWGPLTTQAYNNLLDQLGMSCLSPTTNYWHARVLLILLMRHGFASAPVGLYRYPFCN